MTTLLWGGFWIAVIAVVLFGIIWLINKRAARNIKEAGQAQLGELGNWLWNRDPKAMMQKIIDDAAEEIHDATPALEENKALLLSLARQVDDSTKEVKTLENRLQLSLTDDPEDKTGKAAEYVEQLQIAQNNLTKNKGQLEKTKKLYDNNVKKVSNAEKKIIDAKAEAKQIGVELDMAKTDARISQLATNFNVKAGNLEGFARVKEQMLNQIDRLNAKSEVQSDLGADGMKEQEEEDRLKKAQRTQMLEEYKKKMGIGTPATPTSV